MTTRVPALLKKTLISVWVAKRMTEVDNMDNPDDEDGASNNFLPVHLVDLLGLGTCRTPLDTSPSPPPQSHSSTSSPHCWKSS